MSNAPRLLFVVTEDWYFLSHRLPVARAARAAGFQVMVATRPTGDGSHMARIDREGFEAIPLRLTRSGRNPFREGRAIMDLVRLYQRRRPDIVHHVAIKPVLYGSLAALMSGQPAQVNALAGMGYVFTSRRPGARVLRPLIAGAYRLLLNRRKSRVIVQNHDDLAELTRGTIAPHRAVLIRGAGVDLAHFRPGPAAEGWKEGATAPLAVCVSRMLWDKGIGDLVEAARHLREQGVRLRIALVGDPDPANPASIPETTLRQWQAAGLVEWWGRRDDIATILGTADMAVLPSYREGLPKSLLEAAAGGLPLLASDVPGCREIVREGENGFLVPPRNGPALAAALARLATDPDLCHRLGAASRRLAEDEFSDTQIAAQTLAVYRMLLAGG